MKSSGVTRIGFVFLLVVSTSAVLSAQVDIPVRNWTVPAFQPSKLALQPMTHEQGNVPTVFVPVEPCRLHDTRLSSGGPGPIPASGTRNYDFIPNSTPLPGNTCGTFSEPVVALSLNFSVVNTQGPGFILAYPSGGLAPAVSVLNYQGTPGEIRNNAAIVPVDANGSFAVTAGVSGTDVIIDINGIFLNVLEGGTQLYINATIPGQAAILGQNNSTAAGSHGLGGFVAGSSVHGVQGQIGNSTGSSSGVHGIAPSGICGPISLAGVLGEGGTVNIPIIGRGDFEGVRGINSAGCTTATDTFGALGYSSLTALYGSGNLLVTGTKSFVDPHPTDPTKVIKYISLEGPEAGTYFRGRARFDRGMARISVPEDFRLVTSPEGLSVQVTPIGQMATVAVLKADLNEIVVQASRNVEFYYTVNGIRATFADFQPIQENLDFIPSRSDSGMIGAWSPEQKRRLIANKSYNPDGTVNMETASRLHWDAVWEKGGKPTPVKISE